MAQQPRTTFSLTHNSMNTTTSSVGEKIWQMPDQVPRPPRLDSRPGSPLSLPGAVNGPGSGHHGQTLWACAPLLRAQLVLWLPSSPSLSPITEPPAVTVPWLLCHKPDLVLLSFEIHMGPGEPEISSASASASPAFLLMDRKEGSKVLSQPQ